MESYPEATSNHVAQNREMWDLLKDYIDKRLTKVPY